MRAAELCLLFTLTLAPVAASAQEAPGPQPLELRVTSVMALGRVVIDRGRRDGLAVGDPVVLRPRGGGIARGKVTRVEERRALVELRAGHAAVPSGTAGEVHLPPERLAELAETVEPASAPPEHPPWEETDENWVPEKPLLAPVQAVRPEDRPLRILGSYTLSGDGTLTSDGDYVFGLLRAGTDITFENLFGEGGELQLETDFSYHAVTIPDESDEQHGQLRLDRLSYAWGGTRFARDRHEVGRFLQYGMPEFGLLDGYGWSRRLEGGHRLGASAGYMPEPNEELSTGRDLQIAAWYEWVADESELLAVAGGYQKSFHDGNADRDLFVGRLHYLPLYGWNFQSTAWVDWYTAGDDEKGSGLDLTRAYASAGHRWKGDSGVELLYTHEEFPEIDRDEFLPPAGIALGDLHSDRIATNAWGWLTEQKKLHLGVGAWDDEDESGGDAEVGVELQDFLVRASATDVTLFGSRGEYSSLLGARVRFERRLRFGDWSVQYELSNTDHDGFDDDNDDISQHRVRTGCNWYSDRGWSLSLHADALIWDEESAWSLGFYFVRGF